MGCPADDEWILRGRDRYQGLPGEFTIVRCRACRLMRTNPRPTPEAMAPYYGEHYGPYRGTRVEPARERSVSGLRLRARQLLEFNTERLPRLAPGRLLEVGCASGAFLHRMACDGWAVEGIEYSPAAAAAARGLGYTVHTGALETAPEPSSRYDLVVAWMVVEHLRDPVAGLGRIRGWLKPGGWLVLSVPNAGSYELPLFRDSWYALHLPNHLFHFTPRTLGRLLERSGLKLTRIFHQRSLADLVASAGYRLRDIGVRRLGERMVAFPETARWGHVILFPLAYVLSGLGQTGRMTAWARRDGD